LTKKIAFKKYKQEIKLAFREGEYIKRKVGGKKGKYNSLGSHSQITIKEVEL